MVAEMELNIDGYKICCRETGGGTGTVVILQGWGTELSVYDMVADCLGGGYRVVQFDFPGFGGSDEPREPWSVDDYADFFLRLMAELGIARATLLGHSYGGRVAIKLAAREALPFEIERLVLVDSAGVLPKRSLARRAQVKRYKILKKLTDIPFIHALCPDLIDEWRSRQGSEDYRNASPVMRQCLVKAVNEDLTALLPQVRQETLLIWGDRDTATPLSDGQLMERLLPDAGLAVIRGAGHFCFLEQPAVFRGILRSYFRIQEF